MPRNKYPEETVAKIIETSLRLFLEKGYEQTTILDIVANLGGLTRGAFYHHFKSKEEVLEAIFSNETFSNKSFENAKKAKVANGLERTKLALKGALAENIDTDYRKYATQLSMSLMSNPRFFAEKLKGDTEVAKMLEPFIAEGMADGSIKAGNPKLLSELFMLLCNMWLVPAIFPSTAEETYEKGELVAEIFDSLGFPILDDEMGEIFGAVMETVVKETLDATHVRNHTHET